MIELVLASASPRRAELLRGAGVTIEVCPADCDESPRSGEAPLPYARRIAATKLEVVRSRVDGTRPILAADTVVWTSDDAPGLGKPSGRGEAEAMLRQLLGGEHRVTTAWALWWPGHEPAVHHETTHVWMRTLPEATIEAYLRTTEWCDKAGGYAIQGHAAGWVTRIDGSYTNVVGLPLAQVLQELQRRHAQEGDA